MSVEDDIRKFGNAYDQFGDGITMVPQALLLKAADEIASLKAMRLKLDRRIHNQRKANRDTWEIVEMRRNCMGNPASRASYARLVRAYRELRGVGQSPQREK